MVLKEDILNSEFHGKLNDFLIHQQAGIKSKHTIITYKYALINFLSFLQNKDIVFRDINNKILDQYLIYYAQNPKKKISERDGKVTTLTTTRNIIENFLLFSGINIKKTKIPRVHRLESLTKDTNILNLLKYFFEAYKETKRTTLKSKMFSNLRNLLIQVFLFDTGQRIDAIRNIKLKDIKYNEKENNFILTTKVSKKRQGEIVSEISVVSKITIKLLAVYLDLCINKIKTLQFMRHIRDDETVYEYVQDMLGIYGDTYLFSQKNINKPIRLDNYYRNKFYLKYFGRNRINETNRHAFINFLWKIAGLEQERIERIIRHTNISTIGRAYLDDVPLRVTGEWGFFDYFVYYYKKKNPNNFISDAIFDGNLPSEEDFKNIKNKVLESRLET